MADLLLWWSPEGANLDVDEWDRMIRRLLKVSQTPCPGKVWQRTGPGFRAFGRTTLRSEPESFFEQPGRLILASLRNTSQIEDLDHAFQQDPAVIIDLDLRGSTLKLTRDVLGHKTLVWTRLQNSVLVSTHEEAMLAHPRADRTLDQYHIACVLALDNPPDDSTPFAAIRSVPPAARCTIGDQQEQVIRQTLEPLDDLRGKPDRYWRDLFAGVLQDSVSRATKGATRLGFSLSSGLDSATLAAIVQEVAPPAKPPFSVTYGLPVSRGGDIDEREEAERLAKLLGHEWLGFDAGEIHLSFTLDSGWTNSAGIVLQNPYRELKTAVYEKLQAADVDVLIAGHGADQFASNPADWLWTAWRDRRWRWILDGMIHQVQEIGPIRTIQHGAIRRFAKYLCCPDRLRYQPHPPRGLPERFHERWRAEAMDRHLRFQGWPSAIHAASHFSWLEAADYAFEERNTIRFGLDARRPFRDWRVVQVALSAPSYLLSGSIGYKWLLKEVARSRLGDAWCKKRKTGNISALLKRNYRMHESQVRRQILKSADALRNYTDLLADDLSSMRSIDATKLCALSCWFEAYGAAD